MNKIDLIIDALQELMYSNSSTIAAKKYRAALAAARELKALQPVAFIENHKAGQNLSWSQDDLPYAKATPLYALDEVTK